MRAYDSEMVTGIFENLEAQDKGSGSVSISIQVTTLIPMNSLMANDIEYQEVLRVGLTKVVAISNMQNYLL